MPVTTWSSASVALFSLFHQRFCVTSALWRRFLRMVCTSGPSRRHTRAAPNRSADRERCNRDGSEWSTEPTTDRSELPVVATEFFRAGATWSGVGKKHVLQVLLDDASSAASSAAQPKLCCAAQPCQGILGIPPNTIWRQVHGPVWSIEGLFENRHSLNIVGLKKDRTGWSSSRC